MAMASWQFAVAWLHATSVAFPSSVPVQFRSMELPATNRWGVVETPLLVKTQDRNMDRSFKYVAGCLLMATAHIVAGRQDQLA